MNAKNLRERIAASDGSGQGEIIAKAFDVLLPRPAQIWGDKGYTTVTPEWKLWSDAASRFDELYYASAHTDAALLIAEAVLPGCGLSIHDNRSMPNGAFDAIVHPHTSFQGYGANYDPIGRGCHRSCRALAILDAVCAAVERKEETNG